jgi:hypothetical protein
LIGIMSVKGYKLVYYLKVMRLWRIIFAQIWWMKLVVIRIYFVVIRKKMVVIRKKVVVIRSTWARPTQ